MSTDLNILTEILAAVQASNPGATMYFDLKPKSKKSDLYNFERELLELKEGVEKSRIILLLGPRRIGKSSVLRTFLNECESPSIIIDTRENDKLRRIHKHKKLRNTRRQ